MKLSYSWPVGKRMKIMERKLGRERAYGLCWPNGTIEIDPRQSERERIDTIIHEAIHAIPQTKGFNEDWTNKVANQLSALLWRMGYRRAIKKPLPQGQLGQAKQTKPLCSQ